MGYSLEDFAADTSQILKRDPGPGGREKVCVKLAALLEDDAFIAAYCGPDAGPGARVIHHDPETDFNLLVHVMENDHAGWPHDHGSSWAIYGQAVKHTDMTLWKRLDDGAEAGRAELVAEKTFRLDRATVGVFNEGTIHSIAYPAGAIFVRVTGTDLSKLERLRFDPQNGTVVSEKRPIFGSAA